MKKKLLFVMPTMQIGGSVRNFLSLVSLLDPDHFDITLQLFSCEGPLLEQIPAHVHVREFSAVFKDFQRPWRQSFPRLLKTHPALVIQRLRRLFAGRLPSFRRHVSQKEWFFLGTLLPKDSESYDVAIGYLQTASVYYVVDKVTAKIKIGFVHNEYTAGGYDAAYDNGFFRQLDWLVAVSQAGYLDLQKVFPQYAAKIRFIPNVVSPDFCRQMALMSENPFAGQPGIHIVSVGRLVSIKGFDMAVDAVGLLRRRKYPVIWHIIGDGPESDRLRRQAAEAGVSDFIRFEGELANPYPAIQNAHIYVQTSRSEGWCISLQEAMILGKPVVTTDFPTAMEQVEQGRTGLICAKSPESIAASIQMLLDSPELHRNIASAVAEIHWDPQKALTVFYETIQE